MARTQGPPTDDPFYRRDRADRNSYADGPLSPQLRLDAGLTEADDPDEPQQFRRASRRVPVKRGALPRRIAARARTSVLMAVALGVLGTAAYQLHEFAVHSGRFRIRNESDIELAGEAPNSSAPVMEKMREVLGRNIFLISVAERKRELEKIPWVESATVMRLWPNRLRVLVKERTPVAFVAIGERIGLIDAQGVVMEMSPGVRDNYAFSVIRGMAESDPLSTRAPRMRTFARLVRELDRDQGGTGPRAEGESGSVDGGASGGVSSSPGKVQYSRNLEEVDLSDPEDVKITVKGPSGPILLHLGNENFLPRFMIYLSNVQKWEHDRGRLESVDLRYGRQVILNPDMSAAPPAMAPLNAAGAAMATKKVPRIAARHPQAAPAKPGAAMLSNRVANKVSNKVANKVSNKVANKAAKEKVPTNRVAKARAVKIDAAHSKPQRTTAAKPRHWRGKKRT